MKWSKESYKHEIERLEKWHPWFAWYPVRVGENIYWLEKVERQYKGFEYLDGPYSYRAAMRSARKGREKS